MPKSLTQFKNEMDPDELAEIQDMADAKYGKLLAEMRAKEDMTQVELAGLLNMKQHAISRLENQDDMHLSTLIKLTRALGYKVILVKDTDSSMDNKILVGG